MGVTTRASAPIETGNIDADVAALYRDGIVARRRAFSAEWVEQMRDDLMTAFWAAIQRPGGAIPRGPRRWYVGLHPEQLQGFADLVTHPWLTAMCRQVLGDDYQILEIAFDVPFQGARNQPWHRDFPSPVATYRDHRIRSLAFNVTGVDVTEDMGPFEIAVGTQWDDGRDWNNEMFPSRESWPRYEALGVRKYPQMGDMSCRTALTIHRGTAHASPVARPVLVLGVDAIDTEHLDFEPMALTRDYYASLPVEAREHLLCQVVDELVPLNQKHDIEGLLMGTE